jgi:hypothetical protein
MAATGCRGPQTTAGALAGTLPTRARGGRCCTVCVHVDVCACVCACVRVRVFCHAPFCACVLPHVHVGTSCTGEKDDGVAGAQVSGVHPILNKGMRPPFPAAPPRTMAAAAAATTAAAATMKTRAAGASSLRWPRLAAGATRAPRGAACRAKSGRARVPCQGGQRPAAAAAAAARVPAGSRRQRNGGASCSQLRTPSCPSGSASACARRRSAAPRPTSPVEHECRYECKNIKGGAPDSSPRVLCIRHRTPAGLPTHPSPGRRRRLLRFARSHARGLPGCPSSAFWAAGARAGRQADTTEGAGRRRPLAPYGTSKSPPSTMGLYLLTYCTF